ncbi:MAG: lytic transglycosylase domain-containing protein [Lachnospirales bacterium]
MKIIKFIIFILFIYICYQVSKTYIPPDDVVEKAHEYSEKYGVDEALVLAIINTESKFDQYAVSSAGARGYMQLMETTSDWGAKIIGLEDYSYDNIFDIDVNIELGCWYISNLIEQFDDLDTAIAAYNAGSGNVSKWLIEQNSDVIIADEIPFGETKGYLKKVKLKTKIYDVYLKIIGD